MAEDAAQMEAAIGDVNVLYQALIDGDAEVQYEDDEDRPPDLDETVLDTDSADDDDEDEADANADANAGGSAKSKKRKFKRRKKRVFLTVEGGCFAAASPGRLRSYFSLVCLL